MKEAPQSVAKRIKELREEKGMSREELAQATLMSTSSIICIEENIIQPAVATLFKIARAIGVPAGTFIDIQQEKSPSTHSETFAIYPSTASEITCKQLDYESLAESMGEKRLQPCIISIEQKQAASKSLSSYNGEVFLYLLEGKAIVNHGNNYHELETGDSLYFDAAVPHSIHAKGESITKALIVLSPTD